MGERELDAVIRRVETRYSEHANSARAVELSHPHRLELIGAEDIAIASFGPDAYQIAKQAIAHDWVIGEINDAVRNNPNVKDLLKSAHESNTSTNFGIYDVFIGNMRFRQAGKAIFELRDSLLDMFMHTDIGDVPVSMMRLPYKSLYVEFTKSRTPWGVPLVNNVSGEHAAEGVYISEIEMIEPERVRRIHREFIQTLKLDIKKPVRVIEFQFTGSPFGKDNFLDDACSSCTLYIQDEGSASLNTVLKRHMDFFETYRAEELEGFVEMEEKDRRFFEFAIPLAVKTILYLNADASYQEAHKDFQEYTKKLAKLGHKKRQREEKKAVKPYDYILLGRPIASEKQTYSAGSGRGVKAHWRRGHIRSQPYGPERSLRKVIFIEPMQIGESSDEIAIKTYKVS